MHSVKSDLLELEKQGLKIQVGLIGSGRMGVGLASVMSNIPAFNLAVAVDLLSERAAEALAAFGHPHERIVQAATASEAAFARERGCAVALTDFRIACEMEGLDVIVDATGDPAAGAEIAYASIDSGKHVVMLNIEADAVLGYFFKQMAKEKGVVYTVTSGDEPGAVMEVYNLADLLGFEVLAAGKGKNNVLDVYANPASVLEFARKQRINPRLMCSFIDGSKTMVEMTVLSNATGLVPDVRGMHGPRADVKDLARIFKSKDRGGILEKEGVVDYVIGNVAPGVFVVIRPKSDIVVDDLRYLKLGEGPEFALYRPYHLANVETPTAIAYACLYKKPILCCAGGPVSEAFALAKKDLKPGEVLDEIGGFSYYGSIDRYDVCVAEKLVPLGLLEGAVLTTKVSRDEPITYDMVEIRDSLMWRLRSKMDAELIVKMKTRKESTLHERGEGA